MNSIHGQQPADITVKSKTSVQQSSPEIRHFISPTREAQKIYTLLSVKRNTKAELQLKKKRRQIHLAQIDQFIVMKETLYIAIEADLSF